MSKFEPLRRWHALPLLLAASGLVVCGFWVGGLVGKGHTTAGSIVRTVRIPGRVTTIGGAMYVTTPARTLHVDGQRVDVAARTIEIAASSRAGAPVSRTVAVPVTVSTTVPISSTVTQTITVTDPTATGTVPPPTTVAATITLPVISTITVTLP
jgi:hypothetical protein